jgi:TonB family protein
MMEFLNLLQSFGDQMVEHFWLPVVVWTLAAVPVALFLNKNESLQPIYHYHSRTALLLVLPLGVLGAYLVDFLSSATRAAGEGLFIVIQNPITVSGTNAEPSLASGLSNLNFWIGAVSIVLLLAAAVLLFKLVLDFTHLKKMEQDLNFVPLTDDNDLMESLPSASKKYQHTLIAYAENINIPFTYGWLATKIVVPAHLKKQPSSLAMAVQHELIHIKNRDFLLNNLLVIIKSLFWFHPLIHNLYTSREEYREVICDTEVLANKQFSQKKYASLLFELAQQDHQQTLALSMSVNPSSLKKRIQIMSDTNRLSMNFRSSFLITFFAASLLTLTISCTDMSQDGITSSEVQQAQSKMGEQQSNAPLYFLNGEQLAGNAENNSRLARIKPEYIKNINVLKEDKAINKYGSKAKYGVIEIQLQDGISKETAYSDLKDSTGASSAVPPLPPEKYYIQVAEMPELVGGLISLQKKINYPEKAQKAGTEGKVVVRFIVNKEGKVENPRVIKSVSDALDNETLRVIKQAKFKPGQQDGQNVRVQYAIPITYKLPDSEKDS